MNKPRAKSTTLTRVWVNQPSTLQMDHKYNGMHGLVNLNEFRDSSKGPIVRLWFATGPVVSVEVFKSSLSLGDN